MPPKPSSTTTSPFSPCREPGCTRLIQTAITRLSPLHLAGQLHPALAITALQEIAAGATVLIADEHDTRYSLLHQHSHAPHQQPNVTYEHYHCRCGCIHIAVKTTRSVRKREMLLYTEHTPSATRTLLVQFDGSYKPRTQQGGAGTAAFLVQHNRMQLLEWQAIAIAQCPDNIYAETIGCQQATLLAAQWYAKLALKETSCRSSSTSTTMHAYGMQASSNTSLTSSKRHCSNSPTTPSPTSHEKATH